MRTFLLPAALAIGVGLGLQGGAQAQTPHPGGCSNPIPVQPPHQSPETNSKSRSRRFTWSMPDEAKDAPSCSDAKAPSFAFSIPDEATSLPIKHAEVHGIVYDELGRMVQYTETSFTDGVVRIIDRGNIRYDERGRVVSFTETLHSVGMETTLRSLCCDDGRCSDIPGLDSDCDGCRFTLRCCTTGGDPCVELPPHPACQERETREEWESRKRRVENYIFVLRECLENDLHGADVREDRLRLLEEALQELGDLNDIGNQMGWR